MGDPGDWIPKQVRTAHRRLEVLFAEAREALEEGEAGVAREAVARLREALEIHFEQEDSLYYPSIAALRPEHRPPLQACMDSHDGFRERLAELARHVDGGEIGEAVRLFGRIADAFARHEAAEEQVLAAVERELRAAATS